MSFKSPPKVAAGDPVVAQSEKALEPVVKAMPDVPAAPWKSARSGGAPLEYFSRSNSGQRIYPQPWIRGIVDLLLGVAETGGVHLCLVWPSRLDHLPLLHALANVERNFKSDLLGMRTLFYPGTHASRAALQGVLVSRAQLSDFCRTLWHSDEGGTHLKSETSSESFVAMLSALNNIRMYEPESDNPSIGELIPAFLYDSQARQWSCSATLPLERSLKKVKRLEARRGIREKINAEWADAAKAPGALMVLHRNTKKREWNDALSSSTLRGVARPEVALLDATSNAERHDHRSVGAIPELVQYLDENGLKIGSVIVSDDPKTYFILRSRLVEKKTGFQTHVWAAEADDAVLSPDPVPSEWKPDIRSNSNFSVGIVDRDASGIALAFQRLANEAGDEASLEHKALLDACLYVLRLSNMPAGYSDLTAVAAEDGELDFGGARNAWTPIQIAIEGVLRSGALGSRRQEIERYLWKTAALIDAWSDATPMANRLLSEVRKYAADSHAGLSMVLPNKKYIVLAHRFLSRKLGASWSEAEKLIDWHSLASVEKTLGTERKGRHFAFVGMDRNVLRLLITHKDVPHGTSVLIAYKQAESTLRTLDGMKQVEEFKPYRGRIGLLYQELERRLAEVPNPLAIGKLGELVMTFKLDQDDASVSAGEHPYYKLRYEGGEQGYVSSWVYRYEADEDPFFRRLAVNQLQVGDMVFEMDDDLRSDLEGALHLKSDGLGSVIYPERTLLKLYHDEIRSRCSLLFKETERGPLAQKIRAKMVSNDPKMEECSQNRVEYWLALGQGDNRPHAPRDTKFFQAFCKALEMNAESAVRNWNFIKNARRLNQYLGRELSARYAEILFHPESASVYRKVPEAEIKRLQQAALRCVHRVIEICPPASLQVQEQ